MSRADRKDYCDNARQKITQLKGVDFLRSFCHNIMPLRFVRIRRYGIYNHIVKRNLDLQFIPEIRLTIDNIIESKEKESRAERIIRLTGFDYRECPHCKKGKMIVFEEIPRIRSPLTKLNVLLQGLFY